MYSAKGHPDNKDDANNNLSDLSGKEALLKITEDELNRIKKTMHVFCFFHVPKNLIKMHVFFVHIPSCAHIKLVRYFAHCAFFLLCTYQGGTLFCMIVVVYFQNKFKSNIFISHYTKCPGRKLGCIFRQCAF